MTPEQAAHETREAIVRLREQVHDRPGHLRATAPSSASRAWTSTSPVAAGRSATFPPTSSPAAFVFFEPGVVRGGVGAIGAGHVAPARGRASGPAAVTRGRASTCPRIVDWPTLAALLGRVVAPARRSRARRSSPAGATLAGAGRPARARAAPAQRLARAARRAARRGGAHGRAPPARGDRRAFARHDARCFGWSEPHPDPEPFARPVGARRGAHRPHVRPAPRRARRRRARRARRPARYACGMTMTRDSHRDPPRRRRPAVGRHRRRLAAQGAPDQGARGVVGDPQPVHARLPGADAQAHRARCTRSRRVARGATRNPTS